MLSRSRFVQAALSGIAAGFLAGLFGVGGGILMVPALVMVLGMDQRKAHGTSLAAVVPIAVASVFSYAIAGEVDWAVALVLAVGSSLGAVLGTHLLRIVPQRGLSVLFAALLVATAARLVLAESERSIGHDYSLVTQLLLALAGVGAGVTAGLFGVGGGSVLVPVMVVGVGMTTVLAKGTSLAVIVVTAMVGTWRNFKHQNVDVGVALVAGLAGVAFGFIGGLLSVTMSQQLANALFAALLIVVAAKMLWDLARDGRQSSVAERNGDGGVDR